MKNSALPTYQTLVDDLIQLEQQDGWLVHCQEQENYLVISRELAESLADFLKTLAAKMVLEVCAGRGELAQALGLLGVSVVATDKTVENESPVHRFSVAQSLENFKADLVLGCFVPFDSGVDEAILADPQVEHYIVLNARLGGQLGSDSLWNHSRWQAVPIPQVTQWMMCRHDVWLGKSSEILTHGEAWHLFRRSTHSGRVFLAGPRLSSLL